MSDKEAFPHMADGCLQETKRMLSEGWNTNFEACIKREVREKMLASLGDCGVPLNIRVSVSAIYAQDFFKCNHRDGGNICNVFYNMRMAFCRSGRINLDQ